MYIFVKKNKEDDGGTWPKGQNINHLSQFLTKNFIPFLPFSRFFFLFFFSFIFFFISFLHGSLQPNVFPPYSLHHSSRYSLRFHQISKSLLHLRLVFSSSSSSSCCNWEFEWMNLKNLEHHILSMSSCLFMFNWYELSENWKFDQRNEKESKIGEVESP